MFLSENVIFRELRLSLGHFGQAPESPVSQLQKGVSTSSVPPFIVDLLTFKDYPRSNSFFQWKFQKVFRMGRNSSETITGLFVNMKKGFYSPIYLEMIDLNPNSLVVLIACVQTWNEKKKEILSSVFDHLWFGCSYKVALSSNLKVVFLIIVSRLFM